jgi:hypothetical protein
MTNVLPFCVPVSIKREERVKRLRHLECVIEEAIRIWTVAHAEHEALAWLDYQERTKPSPAGMLPARFGSAECSSNPSMRS